MPPIARRRRTALVALAAAGALVAASGTTAWADDAPAGSAGPVPADVTVAKVDGLPADFALGVDVSTVLSEEASGVVYRDFAGHPADLFTVLKDSGVNYVRIRIWNDPTDDAGHGYGAGDVDVPRAIQIGQRATAAGMRVLLDFHYSDFWADPGKQKAPKAWAGYTADQTVDAVQSFTTDALTDFHAAGVDVGMVQVGNETNNGVAGLTGMTNMARVFNAGSAAVRDVFPRALVAVHFTNPEQGYASVAAGLDANHVDYDVFASSYYPYWHGTTTNLTAQLKAIADTYGKKVMVAETSWDYTLEDGDGEPNTIRDASAATQYPASVQGQATEVHDVVQAVANVGDAGIGVFYWEPAWIPVGPASDLTNNIVKWQRDGSGWATSWAGSYDKDAAGIAYGGSGWDNQALFGFDGNPLASLKVFSYVRTGSIAPRAVYSVAPVAVTVADGDPVTLPSTVAVTYNDGTVVDEPVTWDDAVSWITGPGTYPIPGTIGGGADGTAATATVTVTSPAVANAVVNPSFENASSAPWTVTGTGASIKATGDAHDGAKALAFWLDSAYSFTGSQQITGLTPGAYTLTSTGQGGAIGASDTLDLFATTSEGTVSAPYGLTAWNEFHTPSLTVTVPADGTVTVGARGTLSAGAWGALDEFSLVPYVAPVDTSALRTLVQQAGAIDRSLYTVASLAVLDSAVVKANVVLGAVRPDTDRLAQAEDLVSGALAGLVRVATTSSTSLVLGASSVVYGQKAVVATATVTGSDVAGGTVTFSDGTTKVGSATVGASGVVTHTFPTTLSVGIHQVSAAFTPAAGSSALPSTSGAVTLTVTKATSRTALRLSATTVAYAHKRVVATATVTGPGTAGGTVAFRDGTKVVATRTVGATGVVAYTFPVGLGVGTHRVSAVFTPTAAAPVTGSTSPTVTLKVTRASAKVSAKVTTRHVTTAQRATVRATVTTTTAATAKGHVTVTVKRGGHTYVARSVTLHGSVASVRLAKLPRGTYTVKVTYAGSSTVTSAAKTFTFVVHRA